MSTVRKARFVSAPADSSSAPSTCSSLRGCCVERFGINNYGFLNLWMIIITMLNCFDQSTPSSAHDYSPLLDSQRVAVSLGKHSFSSRRMRSSRVSSVFHNSRRRRRPRQSSSLADGYDNDDQRSVVLASSATSALPPLFWNEGIPVESTTKKKVSAKHKKKIHKRPHLPKVPRRHHAAVSEEDATAKATAALVESLTQPLIADDVWRSLAGSEFRDNADALLAPLAYMGERLAMHDSHDINNEWIEWSVHDKSAMEKPLEDGAIRLWTGRCKKKHQQQPQAGTSTTSYYGSDLPFIKSQSIVPLSVDELVELLLDSDRIQTYNKWSLGRRDCWVRDAYTKIVKNRVHAASKTMISTTLLHARPAKTLSGNGAWVVVSRAVGGNAYAEPDDAKAGRSDILLGCNVLQPIDGDDESCLLTAVTHVYSSAVPKLMAERLGVKGAINFVKDLRKLKVAVAG